MCPPNHFALFLERLWNDGLLMDIHSSSDRAPLSLKSAKLAVAMEKTVLPWIFAFLACQRLSAALEAIANGQELLSTDRTKDLLLFIQNILLFLLISTYGAMLLLSRPATALPTRLRHILVPMAMSYYFLLYGFLDHLPHALTDNLLPPALQIPCSMAGMILSLVGYSIAFWAILYLRRSFAILVSVREIVSKGPHPHIRHPMYLGYLFDSCGIVLVAFSPAILILSLGFVLLLLWRACMEEEKLSEASATYRQYATRAGFLFPRFRGSNPPAAS
jgi:protein-S-isoprenylcysteine O-methyltransferase Ste14